jgi:hypothetical protein
MLAQGAAYAGNLPESRGFMENKGEKALFQSLQNVRQFGTFFEIQFFFEGISAG